MGREVNGGGRRPHQARRNQLVRGASIGAVLGAGVGALAWTDSGSAVPAVSGAVLGGAIGLALDLTRGRPAWRQAVCLFVMAATFAAPIIGFWESQRRFESFQVEQERRPIRSPPPDQRHSVNRALSVAVVVFLISFAGFLVFAFLVLKEGFAERRRSSLVRGGRLAAVREVRIALAATFLPFLALIALGILSKNEVGNHRFLRTFLVFCVLSICFGVPATVLASAHLAISKGQSKWIALAGIPLTPWGGLLLVSLLPDRGPTALGGRAGPGAESLPGEEGS